MAREHHCPNCGPQACNASTSKIHTCGVCAAIWEEDLSIPAPASTPAKPSPPPPAPAAKPAAPAATPAAARPLATPIPSPPSATPAAPRPPVSAAPAAVPGAVATPAPPKPPAPSTGTAPKPARTLSSVVAAAQVRRCPKCVSDGVAAPLDFLEAQGRIVLQDSQTYRGHLWYADTGEPYVRPAAAPRPSA